MIEAAATGASPADGPMMPGPSADQVQAALAPVVDELCRAAGDLGERRTPPADVEDAVARGVEVAVEPRVRDVTK
mgnify:CR=1 FL=1